MTESNLQAQWVQLEFVASVAENPCCTLFNIMYPNKRLKHPLTESLQLH